MVLVGDYDGGCDGADGMNSLDRGERIGGRDGSADIKRGGRCAGGMNSGAFGDKLDKIGIAGTAVLGAGLEAAGGEW